MKTTKFLTLSVLALTLGCSTLAMPAGAFDPGNCDSTITQRTIVPALAAAFVNVKPVHTPSSVAPVAVPGQTPGQHVGPVAGATPPADVPAREVPNGGGSLGGVSDVPSAATPGVVTSWTPDCITIQNGETLTWTNGDADALHGVWFNTCFKGKALTVPGVDKDEITFKYNPAGAGSVKLTIASARATDTSNPGGATGVTPTSRAAPDRGQREGHPRHPHRRRDLHVHPARPRHDGPRARQVLSTSGGRAPPPLFPRSFYWRSPRYSLPTFGSESSSAPAPV